MKYFCVIAILLVLSSCEKTIPIEPEGEEVKPVVNGLYKHGEPLEIELTTSTIVGENTDSRFLTNATADLFVSGHFEEKLEYVDNGTYRSSSVMQPGNHYQINMNTEAGYITASSHLPDTVPVIRIDTIRQTVINIDQWSGMSEAYIVNFTFDDLQGDHYYAVDMLAKNPDLGDVEDIYNLYYYEYDYRAINSALGDDVDIQLWNYLLFPDTRFASERKTYRFGVYADDGYLEQLQEEGYFIYLKFYALEEDYYKYLTSRQVYWNAAYDFFAEAVNLHSNIEGGLGVFAGASYVTVPITIPGKQ